MSLATEGQLAAPAGKFRVIGVDRFPAPEEDWLIGDYSGLQQAEDAASAARKDATGDVTMLAIYVYDDQGKVRHQA
jgi:hypothetical protein